MKFQSLILIYVIFFLSLYFFKEHVSNENKQNSDDNISHSFLKFKSSYDLTEKSKKKGSHLMRILRSIDRSSDYKNFKEKKNAPSLLKNEQIGSSNFESVYTQKTSNADINDSAKDKKNEKRGSSQKPEDLKDYGKKQKFEQPETSNKFEQPEKPKTSTEPEQLKKPETLKPSNLPITREELTALNRKTKKIRAKVEKMIELNKIALITSSPKREEIFSSLSIRLLIYLFKKILFQKSGGTVLLINETTLLQSRNQNQDLNTKKVEDEMQNQRKNAIRKYSEKYQVYCTFSLIKKLTQECLKEHFAVMKAEEKYQKLLDPRQYTKPDERMEHGPAIYNNLKESKSKFRKKFIQILECYLTIFLKMEIKTVSKYQNKEVCSWSDLMLLNYFLIVSSAMIYINERLIEIKSPELKEYEESKNKHVENERNRQLNELLDILEPLELDVLLFKDLKKVIEEKIRLCLAFLTLEGQSDSEDEKL